MALIHFHAVMIDEMGCEFGASVSAHSRDEAYDLLSENYPESNVEQLESPEDTATRQYEIYTQVCTEYDDSDEEDY